MKNNNSKEVIYSEIYIGTLDCVVNEQIYLTDAYSIEDDLERYLEDEFKKWDLSREDPDVKEFPHIKLEYVDEIYACKHKFTLEQVWNVWSDPRDFFKTQDIVNQKIQKQFEENQKKFSERSPPFYLDENGDKISLKKIFDLESIHSKPVCLIAVTRHQYDVSQFLTFEKYVKDELGYARIYYGLWPNKENNKIEYDVLYVIPTNDPVQIQRHLNLHDDLNEGISQEMGLVIFSDGSFEIVRNSK